MASYQHRVRTIRQLLPLLRSPGVRGELTLTERKTHKDDAIVEAFPIAHHSHRCFTVIAGSPRLLPATNQGMSSTASELSDFEGIDGFSLPIHPYMDEETLARFVEAVAGC